MPEKLEFSMDKIDYSFNPSNPYYLFYHGYGNYEGSRCEGSLNKADICNLIDDLSKVVCMMQDKIFVKGVELTKEEITDLYKEYCLPRSGV